MTNEQLNYIEKSFGFVESTVNGDAPYVQVLLKGGSEVYTGTYEREQNANLVKLSRGIFTLIVDIESIAAIGVNDK